MDKYLLEISKAEDEKESKKMDLFIYLQNNDDEINKINSFLNGL